ncbi:MAG: hypothetical protein ACTTJ7_00840 [Treponema sp.]
MTKKGSICVLYTLCIMLTTLIMGCSPKLQGGQVYGYKTDRGDYEMYLCFHSNGFAYSAEMKNQKLVSEPLGKYEITKETIRFIQDNIDTHATGMSYTLVGKTLRVRIWLDISSDKPEELILTKVNSPTEKEIFDAVKQKKKSWLW